MLGPYLAYVFATEVFVITLVYARVIGLHKKRKSVIKTKTTTIVLATPIKKRVEEGPKMAWY